LAAMAGISSGQIYRAAVTANTTMMHLFAGVSPEHLRLEPYVPAFFHGRGLHAVHLKLPIHPDADVLLAPSAGSYVGGDISAGVYAAGIQNKESNSLFIDLGTNGELVLGGKEFLMTCACSAGPAFEGGEITNGMRAARGAIDSVRIDHKSLEPHFTVIGSGESAEVEGICGSGLIDLVEELFVSGCIDSRGKFIREEPQLTGPYNTNRIRRDEFGMTRYSLVFAEEAKNQKEIFISEGDIENFIRAKGAVFSAIRTMLAMLSFSIDDISDVYIAGGIGSGINIEKAVKIGMLPKIPAERYHYLGNTSLAGAKAVLLNAACYDTMQHIADTAVCVDLSHSPDFSTVFAESMLFPIPARG